MPARVRRWVGRQTIFARVLETRTFRNALPRIRPKIDNAAPRVEIVEEDYPFIYFFFFFVGPTIILNAGKKSVSERIDYVAA